MIEIVGLYKSFNDKKVINNFSAEFHAGANCLMGDSGVGKTTLARILLGLIEQDAGEIRGLAGKSVSCVFQENRLIEELSAIKNISLVGGKAEGRALLEELGLGGSIDCAVSTLSGGMKRRIAIARALVRSADVYIFDEPFKGLDDVRRESVVEIIKRYTKDVISIFITHDASDAQLLGARVVVQE